MFFLPPITQTFYNPTNTNQLPPATARFRAEANPQPRARADLQPDTGNIRIPVHPTTLHGPAFTTQSHGAPALVTWPVDSGGLPILTLSDSELELGEAIPDDPAPSDAGVSATHTGKPDRTTIGSAGMLAAETSTIVAAGASTRHPDEASAQADVRASATTPSRRSRKAVEEKTLSKEIMAEHVRVASYWIKHDFRFTRTAYARQHNICDRKFRLYLEIDGSPTKRGERLMAKSQTDALAARPVIQHVTEQAPPTCPNTDPAVEYTAGLLARPGSWDFPGVDDAFVIALDGCCKCYDLRVQLDRGRGHEMFGVDALPSAGVIRIRNGRYAVLFRDYGSEYGLPQDGDRGYHALNALRLGMRNQLINEYRIRRMGGNDGELLLLMPIKSIDTSIQVMRLLASNVYRQAMQVTAPHGSAT